MSDLPRKYFSQLDGLRAIAVLAVIFTHSMPSHATQWMRPGIGGVRLFFVISGFLITGILLDAKQRLSSAELNAGAGSDQKGGKFRVLFAFYMRRCLRIFPIFYIFILVGLIGGVSEIKDFLGWHLLYLSNISTAIRHEFPAVTGHFWSLAVEEQFYLLWPLVVLGVRSSRLHFCLWAMVIAAPVFRYITLSQMGSVASGVLMPSCLDTLAAGGLIAYYRRFPSFKFNRVINSRFTMLCGLGMTLALCLAATMSTAYVLRHMLLDSGMAILFACIVFRVANGVPGRIGAALDHVVSRYVGRISYGIYLYHVATIQLLVHWCGLPLGGLNFLLTTAITIALASISWFLIEQPLNRLKHRFPYTRPTSKEDTDAHGSAVNLAA